MIYRHRDDDQHTHDDFLIAARNRQRCHSVIDHADDQTADHDAEHFSLAAEKTRSADNRSGDRVGFVSRSGRRSCSAEPSEQYDTRNAGAGAGNHKHDETVQIDVDARKPRALYVAAERVDVSAGFRFCRKKPAKKRDDERDDDRHRYEEEARIHQRAERSRKAEHVSRIRYDEHDAEKDRLSAERDDKRMQPRFIDERTVDPSDRSPCKYAHEDRRSYGDTCDHEFCRDHACQSRNRADRQIDARDQNRKKFSET